MNILASYNWIKEYLKTDLPPDVFTEKMTAAGNSVEHAHAFGPAMAHMVLGQVKSLKPHPNADKLRLVEVDLGNEVVEIVCGGTNLKKKQKVAVALPGAKVKWHGEGDFVELQSAEIRGVKSAGMICAACELGFDKLIQGDHEIWDLTKMTRAKPGTPLAEALDLEDEVVFDIEVTSNRPDCMSIVGQAREGNAVTSDRFAWKTKEISAGTDAVSVSVEAPDLCLKYEAVAIDGVKVGPSPWWLQKKLLLAGNRPINNIVDVTNYVLHELGQPMHAFDADTLHGGKIIARRARAGEKILALDGKEYSLANAMLVIADQDRPIAIAGVMGGETTGTTEKTTRIILESATFHPVSIRKTARALSISSDSSQLFEKGLSPQATRAALARAVELVLKVAGGHVASAVFSFEAKPYVAPHFSFDPAKAQALMGVALPAKDMIGMLKMLGFAFERVDGTNRSNRTYTVSVPFWRDHDIENPRDFVEEIARLYGYTNIPSVLLVGDAAHGVDDPVIEWERRIKDSLRGAGLSELYGMNFTSDAELSKYGFDPEMAVRIQNPLASDQSLIRPSLIPSMLSTVEANERRIRDAALFEIGTIHIARTNDIPVQEYHLTIGQYGKSGDEGFKAVKGILERLFRDIGIHDWKLERPPTVPTQWHSTRVAQIIVGADAIGIIGQISSMTSKAFGLESDVVCADIAFETLVAHASRKQTYKPIPSFPEVKRDLAVVLNERTVYADVVKKMTGSSSLLKDVELFDLFRGQNIQEGKKSIAMHLTFRADGRTLLSEEIDRELANISRVLEQAFGGIMRV